MNDIEEFLERCAANFFNKGRWRYLEDGKPKTKGHLMEAVYKMQHAKMKDSDIAVILENIFNDAYVEHEKQVKEATGLDCETLYITKAKTAVMVEETAQV